MLDSLYPRYYLDFAEEGEAGGGEDDPGNGNGERVGEEDAADVVVIAPVVSDIDVSTIPGNKYITSFTIPSSRTSPLIDGSTEGNIPANGLAVPAHIIGSPGAKFYLNIVDIDDDEVFNLSNVYIPASGKYTAVILFPKSNTTNKYKINLRPGDGTRINTNLPTTDPMWTIHQYPNPTITFTKTTGTATGVTYSGGDATLTASPNTVMNVQTSPFQSTSLIDGTSIELFGEFNYAVTAAKSGALVYIKTKIFPFVNSTIVTKKVDEEVINNNIVKLESVENLVTGMEAALDTYTKTKLYDINNLTLELSNIDNLQPGMVIIESGSEGVYIVSIENSSIIVSSPIAIKDKSDLTFRPTVGNSMIIKSIDTNLKEVALEHPVGKINKGTLISFKNNEMDFTNTVSTSASGSASTVLTNTIKLLRFGTKDVTFTLPTDDIFTLTPNAYDQRIDVIKETATDINVLALDNDSNSGSKTPSTVRNPVHGVITGSYGSGDGTITYTPAIGFTGEDSFTFKVNDGTTDSETKTIFITVKK